MASYAMDSKTAQGYIINPLIEPNPSEETGLNSSFRSTFAPPTESQENLVKHQQSLLAAHRGQERALQDKIHVQPTTTTSFSPKKASPLGPNAGNRRRASSTASPPSSPPYATGNGSAGTPLRRGASLNHGHSSSSSSPRSADRRRKRLSIPVDTIDTLDFGPGGPYHHEGPFDATLISRNMNPHYSPVAALATTNAEALKATPRENVLDALVKHRPLEGTASVPPGVRDEWGRRYNYKENNVMEESGYGRMQWVGADRDEVQKANMDRDPAWKLRHDYPSRADLAAGPHAHGNTTVTRTISNDEDIELQNTKPSKTVDIAEAEVDDDGTVASGSGISRRQSLKEGIKRRIGSLRKKNN